MSPRDALGELEQILLLAVLRLGSEAYTRVIGEEVEAKAGRSISLGTIYVTLARLEKKGLVESSLGDPTPVRGGRPKRFYAVTNDGREALRRSKEALTSLWEGLELEAGTRKSR